MLELLFLPQHATVSAPPSQHLFASADLSLHRSVIDMSSIYHGPTAEDYLHPTAALVSTYRHAETFLRPPTAPAFNHHPASSSSVSLQLPASALHSSVHLLPSPPSPSWYCSTTYRDSLMITEFDNPVNSS